MKHEKKTIACGILLSQIAQHFSNVNKTFQFDASSCSIFDSKKHYVVKTTLFSPPPASQAANQEVVIKYFNREIKQYEQLWENERNMHQQISNICRGKSVPKIIDTCPGIIMYEYIQGASYKQLLLQNTLTDSSLQLMVRGIVQFHHAGLIFKDPRLDHFLITPHQEFYIFDYEEMDMGNPRENLAQILTSFIDLSPGILENSNCDYFLERMLVFLKLYLNESYDLKNEIELPTNSSEFISFWTATIIQNLRLIAERREITKSLEQWEQIISKLKQTFIRHFS